MTTASSTATEKTEKKAQRDFESVMEVASAPEAVLAALRTRDGVAGWWGPTVGSAEEGGRLSVGFGGSRQIDIVVIAARLQHVEWVVEAAPHTPEWDGTTIVFDLEPGAEGTVVRFRHDGLTPQLECFDMCHAGWTHYLGSLVDYVDRGEGQPYVGD